MAAQVGRHLPGRSRNVPARGFSIASSMPDHIFFVLAEDGTACQCAGHRMPQHAMPYLYTRTQASDTIFLCANFYFTQACQRGSLPWKKRTLKLIYVCLSLAALGFVSLAGCEDQKPSHLTETVRVCVSLSLYFIYFYFLYFYLRVCVCLLAG